MFWLILFILLIALSLGGFIYLVTRVHRFSFIKKLAEKHKALSWIVSVIPLIALLAISTLAINVWSAIVIFLHLVFFWLAFDIIASHFRRTYKSKQKLNIEGALAILFTFVYLLSGWKFAHTVYRTDYAIQSSKELGQDHLKIVGFADSHLGITLNGEQFAAEMQKIQAEEPDIVLLAGDFVDDDSCRADMETACKALGELKTKYGVYYVDGNHDKGYFESSRDFTYDEVIAKLEENNVVVLRDESILVDDKFYVVGRKDKSDESRMPVADLTKDIDDSKFTIIMDHQPNDYKNESETCADLVFSGHTHGGHIWPAGFIGLMTGANDSVYGAEEGNGTAFIVTSGISGWAIPFKTGTKSEYVVMDIHNKQQNQ